MVCKKKKYDEEKFEFHKILFVGSPSVEVYNFDLYTFIEDRALR